MGTVSTGRAPQQLTDSPFKYLKVKFSGALLTDYDEGPSGTPLHFLRYTDFTLSKVLKRMQEGLGKNTVNILG